MGSGHRFNKPGVASVSHRRTIDGRCVGTHGMTQCSKHECKAEQSSIKAASVNSGCRGCQRARVARHDRRQAVRQVPVPCLVWRCRRKCCTLTFFVLLLARCKTVKQTTGVGRCCFGRVARVASHAHLPYSTSLLCPIVYRVYSGPRCASSPR